MSTTYRTITASEVEPGMRMLSGGKGWDVREVTPEAHLLRIRLIAPWRGGERTSALWRPDEPVKIEER